MLLILYSIMFSSIVGMILISDNSHWILKQFSQDLESQSISYYWKGCIYSDINVVYQIKMNSI